MKKFILAGNWKMNTNFYEAVELAESVNLKLSEINFDSDRFVVILAPPFTNIYAVSSITNKKVFVASQNIAQWEKGAYTGEVSAEMVKSVGASYCILGHSERRQYFYEDSKILNQKLKIALKNSLIPIFCIGEKLIEREQNLHFDVVRNQLEETLFTLNPEEFEQIVIAYEPVWAIGTGVNATPAQAQEMHEYIRSLINKKFGQKIAENTTILYGGSCNPLNGKSLFEQKDIDGGLIGGASLKSNDFIELFMQLIEAKKI